MFSDVFMLSALVSTSFLGVRLSSSTPPSVIPGLTSRTHRLLRGVPWASSSSHEAQGRERLKWTKPKLRGLSGGLIQGAQGRERPRHGGSTAAAGLAGQRKPRVLAEQGLQPAELTGAHAGGEVL